ncbi:MAG: TetR/AcrR family transcriptional regulator [Qingshengfaniella sp.]
MARPRKQDSLKIPERAVEEGLNILRTQPDRFSLLEIARRIGCSGPALYAHFTNRDDLLDHIRSAVHATMAEEKRQRFAGMTVAPLARLRLCGQDYVAFAQTNPALYRLIFAPPHATGDGICLDSAVIAPLAAGVRAAQTQGHAAGADADQIARMMWFTVHGAIMMALDSQLPGPAPDRWQRGHDAVDTVMALLTSQPEQEKDHGRT